MRKTTIFRSSGVATIVVLLVVGAGRAQAQDTLLIQPATPVDSAAPMLQEGSVHVVAEGETLWGIATLYFGDPLLWPEIYRQNTLVVEDPHWIFPGEELRLGPAPAGEVAIFREPGVEADPEAIEGERVFVEQPPEAELEPEVEVEAPEVLPPPVAPPPPPTETAPTVFARRPRGLGSLTAESGAIYRYRPIRRHEFYAAGFLTEGEDLPWGDVLGAVGRPTLRNLRATSSQRVFGDVEIRPPEPGAYQVGDSLLVANLRREVSDWGYVVVPTGIVVVTETTGDRVIARVVTQFSRIADGQRSLPIEPFADPGDIAPVPVQNGLEGTIIEPRDLAPVPGQQDIIFIDHGRSDGVTLGDVFAVLRPADREGFAPDTVGYMTVVHVREHSASALLMIINDLGVEPGAPVQLYRKMP